MIAFIFPGQGSQSVGMCREIYDTFQESRDVFEAADEVLGWRPSVTNLCLIGPASQLQLTKNAQPAILAASIATLRAVERNTDLRPDVVAGHSLGEYSALVAAGVLEFRDAVRLVHLRGKFMQKAVPVGEGKMAALGKMAPEEVRKLCEEAAQGQIVVPANFNSPKQIVISGHATAVERAVKLAKERGGIGRELPVSAPFHCPLMEPAAKAMADELAKVEFSDARIPVVTNVEAQEETKGNRLKELLIAQITGSVRWIESVEKMVELGVQAFAEIGPGTALASMVRQINPTSNVSNYNTPVPILNDDWEVQEHKRVHKKTGRIVWSDGMEWDPEAHQLV